MRWVWNTDRAVVSVALEGTDVTRLSIWFEQRRHRLLMFLSPTYREFESIRLDRDRWKRECVAEGNKVTAALRETEKIRKGAEDLHARLQKSQDAQEQATRQLLSERTLRQTADSRASQYHAELVAALKASANWASKNVNRRAMYSDVNTPDLDLDLDEKKPAGPEPVGRVKPFARDISRRVTDQTLAALLDDVRAGDRNAALDDIGQVGPEFSSAG